MNRRAPSTKGNFQSLIKTRIKKFWGYGNVNGDVWFVGMEEGCDGSIPQLVKRFVETSGGEVFDMYDDMRSEPKHMNWFKEGAPTQPTYRKLIYLLLYFDTRKEPTIEDIREYQIKHFGRKKSNHAVLELMPLPAQSLEGKHWVYASSGVEGLSSRREYLKVYKPERVKRLRELIRKHKPRLVIFYSMGYLEDWKEAVEPSFTKVIDGKLYIAKDDSTLYAIVPHSVAQKMSNVDWRHIAEKIMTEVGRR